MEANTDLPWVLLHVKRWLAAPLQLPDGTLQERDRGTPQGSSVSPVLANLFMHYAFDMWMSRNYPGVWFERYADDAVVHCATERQAREVLAELGERMAEVGLQLHPDKTKIVYCKDSDRRGSYEHTSFTFLGFEFRGRRARGKNGRIFTSFLPAVSKDALKKMSATVRSWRNTRDFRCLKHSGALWSWCPVSVLGSVFALAAVVCGHGFCPRVAAGLARGSTVRGPGSGAVPPSWRVPVPATGL